MSRRLRWRWWLKWFWIEAWTEENFCRVLTSLNLAIARSRRRKGRCEFSARLFNQRLISWRPSLPITFIAARYDCGVVTLLNDRAVNWHRTQAQAVAVAVCHRLIAWLRNWRNVFREIR